MFSSKSLIVSGLTFKSLIHFEFIFVYGVRECSNFILFIAIQSYLKKQEISQINNITLHLKQLENEEQKISKVSRRKEIIKMRLEINEKEMKEMEFGTFNWTACLMFESDEKV